MDMLNIQKAQEFYTLKFKQENQLTVNNKDYNQKLDEDILRYVSTALKSISSASFLFNNSCVFDSLINALKTCVSNGKDVVLVSKGYQCLEKYFRLLVAQPWKPEYRILKMYGGYYKTKIKTVIIGADTIFQLAGYVVDQDDTMVYRRADVDKDQLLSFSFNCFLASFICEKIASLANQYKTVGKSLEDAVSDTLKQAWPKDWSSERPLFSNKSSSKVIPSPELGVKEPPFANGFGSRKSSKEVIYPTDPLPVYDMNINENPEKSIGNFKYKPTPNHHIPFIDLVENNPKVPLRTPVENSVLDRSKFEGENVPNNRWKPPHKFPNLSNVDVSITYPPGRPAYRGDSGDNLVDEGIGMDLASTAKCNLGSSASYGASYPAPALSDQGYITGTSLNPNQPVQNQEMISDTIYLPPAVVIDGKISQAARTKCMGQPPPIPNRDLKPKIAVQSVSVGNDEVDGLLPDSPLPFHSKDISPSKSSNLSPNINHPQSILQMRSRSLKMDSKKLILDDRPSRSMDYSLTQWQCPQCYFTVPSSLNSCSKCDYKRGGKPVKSCKMCTLDNDWRSTICDACEDKLPQHLSYK